jgi:hypothetical protein
MPYSYIVDFPVPIEVYDAMHAEILGQQEASAEGLILHIGRETQAGFQILEIWESKEQCDRFNEEVVGPIVARLSGGQPQPTQRVEVFEVRGLVIPNGNIVT